MVICAVGLRLHSFKTRSLNYSGSIMKVRSNGAQAKVSEVDRGAPSFPCGCHSLKLVVLASFNIGRSYDTLWNATARLHVFLCQHLMVGDIQNPRVQLHNEAGKDMTM
jgi:hypothetical protein